MVVAAGKSGNSNGRLTLSDGETICRLTGGCSDDVGVASIGGATDGTGVDMLSAQAAGHGRVWTRDDDGEEDSRP